MNAWTHNEAGEKNPTGRFSVTTDWLFKIHLDKRFISKPLAVHASLAAHPDEPEAADCDALLVLRKHLLMDASCIPLKEENFRCLSFSVVHMFHCNLLWTWGIRSICSGLCECVVVPTACAHQINIPLTREASQRGRGQGTGDKLDESETDGWSDRHYENTPADMSCRMIDSHW